MSITKIDKLNRNFFLGFIRLHLMHHASVEPIFGLDMIRELGRHGYELSPGTLYPILHGLERDGFLRSQKKVVEGKARKYYTLTNSGSAALHQALGKIRELMEEITPVSR
ncbi:MAG: helix-turn-helix transcriptional regulator [Anaerolineales bacterium]|nr:helix-turn-helix transcriptional regulator [Anaerolineales bacterium]MCE7861442.1 PadR family transcriptional regulator [Chloroflexi bacterium CFX2]GJQ34154.1 MAG: PadR family transcriptional regulator [Anaerolineaceae bacterium]